MPLTRSSVLFHRSFRGDRRVHAQGGPQGLFLRDSAAYEWNGSMYVPRITNQPRFEPVRLYDGRVELALMTEPASEQEITHPFDFAHANWTKGTGITRDNAVSVVQGQAASQITSDSTADRQVHSGGGALTGNFTASPETATFLVESGTKSIFDVEIYNVTDSLSVVRKRITFASGAVTDVSGTGTAAVIKRADSSRNGGRLLEVRLRATGTSGKARRVIFYPIGNLTGGGYSFLHGISWGENPWGGVWAGPANTTQAADIAYFSDFPAPQDMAGYGRFVAGMIGDAVVNRRIWQAGLLDNASTLVLYHPSDTSLELTHISAASRTSTASLGATVRPGDLIEYAWALVSGAVYLVARRVGGVVGAGSLSSTTSYGSTWSGPNLYLSRRSDGLAPNKTLHLQHLVVKEADLVTTPGTSTETEFFTELHTFARSTEAYL